MPLFSRPVASPLSQGSPLSNISTLFALSFAVFMLWRVSPALPALRRPDRRNWLRQKIWAPHAATIVIGVSFVITLLLAGRWAYTDVLADLAASMGGGPATLVLPVLPVLLLRALYAGALVGGLTAGRWQSTPVSGAQLLRCLCGGVAMGWGSLLIPGSNDGLILIGIPLLHPYAWLALATMVGAIAAAMKIAAASAPVSKKGL